MEKYSINESQLRIYFHYQPTFYHLHVHFTYVQYSAPGSGCDRGHLLNTVINNIELIPDYYQKATIPFTIKQEGNLFAKYEEKGIVKKITLNHD